MIASSLPDSRGKTFFPCRKHNKHGAGHAPSLHAPPGRWLLASIPWEGHLSPLLLEAAAPPGLQDWVLPGDVVLQVPVPTLIPPPGALLPCVPRLSLVCGPEFGLGAETRE